MGLHAYNPMSGFGVIFLGSRAGEYQFFCLRLVNFYPLDFSNRYSEEFWAMYTLFLSRLG